MKKILSLLLTLSLISPLRFAYAQEPNANSYAAEYLKQMEGVTDQEKVREIRETILSREDIDMGVRIEIVKEVGEKHLANIEAEGNREIAWIRAEAAISAAIRLANYGCAAFVPAYKDPAKIAAVDSFAETILQGKARDAIVKIVDNGDWSGFAHVAADVGVGAAVGYVLDPQFLRPIIQNTPLKNGVLKISENPALREKIGLYTTKASDLYDDIYRNLQPKIGKMKGELADLYRKLNKAAGKEERASVNAAIAKMEQEIADLGEQVSKKQLEVGNLENVIEKLTYDFQQSAQAVADQLISQVDDAIQDLWAKKREFNGTSFEDLQNFVANQVGDMAVTVGESLLRIVDSATEKYVTEKMNAADREYDRNAARIENEYESGRIVLKGGVEESVYIDNTTGEIILTDDDKIPANILDSVFDTLPTEAQSAVAIAIDEFVKQTSSVEGSDGDENLGEKIGALVKEKLAEAYEKGEEWVENGGIRDLIKKEVDKLTEGKLSEADQQHILNMVDGICNANKDGGQSFIDSLGKDGVPVATTFAINALKKQISDALPTDQADVVNGMLDALGKSTNSAELKQNVLAELQKLIAEKIPFENSANVLNGVLDKIANNQAVDVLATIPELGKCIAIDELKAILAQHLDPEVAKKISDILEGVAKNGVQGGVDAALEEAYALIDKYAPGTASAEQLKKILGDTVAGKVTAVDINGAATAFVSDYAKQLIDKSGLPPEAADLAKTAIDGLAENGLNGLTDNIGDYIEGYVADKLGDDAGNAVGEVFDAVVTPGGDAWAEIVKQAPTIGKAIGQKVLANVEKVAVEQLTKWINQCPTLKKVLNALGITPAGVVKGVKNVLGVLWQNRGDFSKAITQLSKMAVGFLKEIAKNLINSLIQWGIKAIFNNLVKPAVNWAAELIARWSDSTDFSLLSKGLDYLRQQLNKVKSMETITIKTDPIPGKIVNWIESKVKKPQSNVGGGSTTVITGGTTVK